MTSGHATHQEVLESKAATEAAMRPQQVPVNVYETSGALVVVAPIPAVTAGDVTVELDSGRLRFWASLRSAGTREFLIKEWDYGGYEREIDLPGGYGAGVEASVANGQLVVRVLRGEPTGPLTIQPHATPIDRV
ncbi:MAG: Hsp20/alpha crystallin family protein [Acidimicrobiia bacterium]